MEATTRSVDELPEPALRTLENLLGRQLLAHQRVFLAVLPPTDRPDDESRRKGAQGLRELIAQAQQHADAQGVTDSEIDEAVGEAMAQVRHRVP